MLPIAKASRIFSTKVRKNAGIVINYHHQKYASKKCAEVVKERAALAFITVLVGKGTTPPVPASSKGVGGRDDSLLWRGRVKSALQAPACSSASASPLILPEARSAASVVIASARQPGLLVLPVAVEKFPTKVFSGFYKKCAWRKVRRILPRPQMRKKRRMI